MKTKLDVIAQIRFQLDQLSAKNAHHEFEHLCRFLTQARICSNVLPATGPVSAGGDQGRDFETFRTYLSGSPIADSSFVGLASDQTLAFACTLQRDKVPTKIKSDLDTILVGSPRPHRVYFFAASDLPVAKRHELQQEARDTHGVELEILDGQAISELLAERDVFWIAERYLSLASDLLPRVDDSDWYADALRRWKQTTEPSYSHAEYTEIRAAIRYVVSDSKNKQDLTFWLDSLERFRVNASSPVLRRRAIYEIAVSHLRGRGSMVVTCPPKTGRFEA